MNATLIQKAFSKMPTMLNTTVENLLRNHPDFSTTFDGGHWLITKGTVTPPNSRSRVSKIDLTIPGPLLENEKFPRRFLPYGEWFTTRITRHVFRKNWFEHSCGIIPGEFWYEDYTNLYFAGQLDPRGANSLLMYADAPMDWYGGANNLTTIDFGDGIYGLLLPINFIIGEGGIFTGLSIHDIYDVMEYGLKIFLETA